MRQNDLTIGNDYASERGGRWRYLGKGTMTRRIWPERTYDPNARPSWVTSNYGLLIDPATPIEDLAVLPRREEKSGLLWAIVEEDGSIRQRTAEARLARIDWEEKEQYGGKAYREGTLVWEATATEDHTFATKTAREVTMPWGEYELQQQAKADRKAANDARFQELRQAYVERLNQVLLGLQLAGLPEGAVEFEEAPTGWWRTPEHAMPAEYVRLDFANALYLTDKIARLERELAEAKAAI